MFYMQKYLKILIYTKNNLLIMSKSKKIGKPKKNRTNQIKNLRRIKQNEIILAKAKAELV